MRRPSAGAGILGQGSRLLRLQPVEDGLQRLALRRKRLGSTSRRSAVISAARSLSVRSRCSIAPDMARNRRGVEWRPPDLPEREAQTYPAASTSSRSAVSGRAPTWLMISAAHRLPSAPQVGQRQAAGQAEQEAGGVKVAGAGRVGDMIDRRGRRYRAPRSGHPPLGRARRCHARCGSAPRPRHGRAPRRRPARNRRSRRASRFRPRWRTIYRPRPSPARGTRRGGDRRRTGRTGSAPPAVPAWCAIRAAVRNASCARGGSNR